MIMTTALNDSNKVSYGLSITRILICLILSLVIKMKPNILIGVSGSVATIKLPLLIKEVELCFPGCSIKIIATSRALGFISRQDIGYDILTDEDEWKDYKFGDSILHIELRKWADILLIAPLSANTMAKLSNGICDNLLTCVARAWDTQVGIFVAPAMNTGMYNHPISTVQLQTLKEFGYIVISPIEKKLACGDVGIGAMATPSVIVGTVKEYFNKETW